ncbi:MAG: ATP-binding protein [bacterium]
MDLVHVLERVRQITSGEGSLQRRLGEALGFLAHELGFDSAVFYWKDKEARGFEATQSSHGWELIKSSAPFAVGEGVVGACGLDGRVIFLDKSDAGGLTEERWADDFPAYGTVLAVPAGTPGCEQKGVLVLLHGTSKQISQEQVRMLQLAGGELAWCMITEELREQLRLRLQEMEALNEVGKAVGGTLDLDPLMELALETTVRVVGARAGVLRLLDEELQLYRVTSVAGGGIKRKEEFKNEAASECPVVRTAKPHRMVVSDKAGFCSGEDLGVEVSSCACVPLVERGKIMGVMSLYDRVSGSGEQPGPFTDQDLSLLETMGGFIAGALARAMHHKHIEQLVLEKESMVRELTILYASGSAMMKATDVQRLLRVILVALTLGNGLGFNRAMLFLVNERDGVLQGRVGVGPASADDAGRIWGEMTRSQWDLHQWLEWALSQDARMTENTLIQKVATSIRIPLDDTECVLVRALRAKGAFCLDPRENPRGIELLSPLEIGTQCAMAPVVARGEALGVILVDNIYSRRPIVERDLRFLGAFASLAGLAIQNAMFFESLRQAHQELQAMQQRLIQSEKLAALGEFAATMAHEIRNPLVSIGGYARLLQKKHKDDYSRIIYEEVERLEGILSRVLDFSKVSPGHREETEISSLLEECYRSVRVQLEEPRLKVRKEFTGGLPPVQCDRDQLKQVFLNLMQNALDAMSGKGTLSLRTYLASEEEGTWVVAELSDTGGGIPSDILPNIFNPFFTTKNRGTGLGLAIVRRIVEMHGGRIEVDNRPGQGTTFRVKLPPSF